MVRTTTIAADIGSEAAAVAPTPREVQRRMRHVREAFRLHRSASDDRRRWMFYLEHNLFDEARLARVLLLAKLRCACAEWRAMLSSNR